MERKIYKRMVFKNESSVTEEIQEALLGKQFHLRLHLITVRRGKWSCVAFSLTLAFGSRITTVV